MAAAGSCVLLWHELLFAQSPLNQPNMHEASETMVPTGILHATLVPLSLPHGGCCHAPMIISPH